MKESTNSLKLKRKPKRIAIFHPGPLFPVVGMSQVRVINQIKSLARLHSIDLIFLYTKNSSVCNTIDELGVYCSRIIPIKTITQSIGYQIAKKIFVKKLLVALTYPYDYFYSSNFLSAKKISHYINTNSYDAIITHYWQSAGFFKFLRKGLIRCIDTHYAVEENIELLNLGKYDHIKIPKLGKMLEKELIFQNQYLAISDIIIVNSYKQKKLIEGSFPQKKILVTPNGQEIEYYTNFQKKTSKNDETRILFYGALSNQFNSKALKRIIYELWPELKRLKPNIKLIVMGSNPPEWLLQMNCSDIEIKGYVKDVRPIFADSYLALLPLDSGSGFRGRAVELLASGVPIIGTNNAMESIGIEHYKNGFIAESNNEIIELVIMLINNNKLREKIARESKLLAKQKFSLEATFGKLSNYLLEIDNVR